MIIIKPKFIMLCDKNFTILQDKAVAFDKKIEAIGDIEDLSAKFSKAEIIEEKTALLAPAFINPHVHLEFSANKTSLVYGDFLQWLNSVISSRSTLSQAANTAVIKSAIKTMQRSGVATIGAISSFGGDLQACTQSSARVIYFNEILGTNEDNLEQNWQNFITRFKNSKEKKGELLIPAISIHSPYSTHIKLAKSALKIAKSENLLVSTHLLESDHEKRWLESASGEFKQWLSKFNKNTKPMYKPNEFIELFNEIKTLFTHCVYVDDFSKFSPDLHSITHCAFSNRLLSKKRLDLANLINQKIEFNIGTDGLSSNISLNFFDELRANLLIHNEFDPLELSKILILASTLNAAKAIRLDSGEIKQGKIADLALYRGFENAEISQLPLMFLLHTSSCVNLFINGKNCQF
ncbi:MAG: aminofutalosine deaminase family hydrolase [Campylobacter sp.]